VNLAGWMNTEPAIIIAVQRQSGADVIATVDAIKKALPQLEASLPPSLKIHIVSDRHADDPRQRRRRSTHTAADRWAGRRRHSPLPAQALGDCDPGDIDADVADRHLHGLVCASSGAARSCELAPKAQPRVSSILIIDARVCDDDHRLHKSALQGFRLPWR